MSSPTDPEYDAESAQAVRLAAQQAVDTAATAYTDDASVDVERRLREEMSARGLEVDDERWIADVAHGIRSGHHVVLDEPPSDD